MKKNSNKKISLLLVSVLLFFSGAASLIYEVIWTRILHYVFGNTEMAAATVLATFMGGLALGGDIGGKFTAKLKKPLLAYGILELTIALYGLFFTGFLYKLDFIYSFVSSSASTFTLTTIRFLFGVIFMIVPTVAMGATLPVLIQGTVERDKSGFGMAILYFVNTLGAVVGTFISGFALIPKYGLDISIYIAATMGILVFLSVLIVQFKNNNDAKTDTSDNNSDSDKNEPQTNILTDSALKYGSYAVYFAAFSAGFISLANEVLWFRVLGILMDGTIYGFSALLTAFLSGIAAGSLWISRKLDKTSDLWSFYVKLQIGALFGALFFMIFIPFVPFLVSGYLYGTPKKPSSVFALKFLLVFIPVFIPTFFYGASFPLTIKLASFKNSLGKAAGNVYAINTLGCILGAISAGMIFMPIVKNINTLLVAMLIAGLLSPIIAVFLSGTSELSEEVSLNLKLKLFGYLALFLFAVILINPDVKVLRLVNSRYSVEDYSGTIGSRVKSIYGDPKESKNLVFEAEGKVTIVTVHKTSDGGYRLRNNGLNESYHSTEDPYYAEEIFYLGMLPFLLHPEAKTGMLIGLGGGGTLDIMSQTSLKYIDVAELEAEVVKASRIMFDNRHHPLDDPKVHLHIDDGRNALLRKMHEKPGFYDIIVSQPSHPWLSGAANLYTVEHFKTVRKNLAKNGIFCQWINLFRMNEKGFKSLMAAFVQAFSDGYVFQVDENSVFLIGINGHLKIDPEIIKKQFASKKLHKLLNTYFSSPARIFDMYMFDYKTARKLATGAIVNSDRRPVIETVLPWVDHNKMFYVEKLLKKDGLKYGINPSVMPNGAANYTFYKKYVDKIREDISLDDDEPEHSQKEVKKLIKVLDQASTLNKDEIHRLKSKVYSQISNFTKAEQELELIVEQTSEDIDSYVDLLKKQHRLSEAAMYEFVNLLPAYYKYYALNIQFTHKQVFDTSNLLKTLVKVGFSPSIFKFLIKPMYSFPEFNDVADEVFWHSLSWFELSKKKPREDILQTDLDAGETDLPLLKQMLMYYAMKKNHKKVDFITDLIRTAPDSDKNIYDLAVKMENFDLYEDAFIQISYLYSKSSKSLEPLLLVKKLIKYNIKLKKYDKLKKLFKRFYELSPSDEEVKEIKQYLEKLPLKYKKEFKKLNNTD